MIDFTLDTLLLVQWVVAVFLPLLVGLVTTKLTSSLAKALLLAGLNALVAIGTELARALEDPTGSFDAGQALFQLLTALAIAWGAYGQFWKPTGAAAAAQRSLVTPRHQQDGS
jgi:hypothetical protein